MRARAADADAKDNMSDQSCPPFGGQQYNTTDGSLYQSDSTFLLKWLTPHSVDLIITDPPYGIAFRSNRQRVDRKKSVNGEGSVIIRDHYFSEIENDETSSLGWLVDGYRVLKDGGAMYVFAHWTKWKELQSAAEQAGFSVKNMIVLNKSNHGMGDLKGSFAPRHELMLFATKGRHELRFPQGRIDDIWSVPVKFSGSRRFHPNEKPLTWVIPAIENSSDVGNVILDPFMGSGTTGVAAVSMDRKFIGCEKDKDYFETSKLRFDKALDERNTRVL